jgi:molybdate transport system substrate-binding protein
MTHRFLVVSLIFINLLTACGSPATRTPLSETSRAAPTVTGQTLTVFAAASLTDAFTELGNQFEAKNPGVKMVFNFAGSQQLAQQLAQGAPADVFASANQAQMDVAIQGGRVHKDQPSPLAGNLLVVIFAQPGREDLRRLQDLANPGLKLVFADKNVPVGKYALEFLDRASKDPDFGAGFKDAVLKNVVSYEENVRAVLTKISLGEADAGIVYTSDINLQEGNQVGKLEIPADLNVNALYFIAPVEDSQQPGLARAFVDFLLAPESQDLLARYGFQPVQ